MSDLSKAISIATSAHKNQVDKGGKPYIEHPIRVMKQMRNDAARIVAVLHDVIEDSDYSFDDLVAAGFTEEIVQAIEVLTKQKGESYKNYLRRIQTNPIAIVVKLADLLWRHGFDSIANYYRKRHRTPEKIFSGSIYIKK